ncbi:MAG: Uncharacterised protein [Polaribacter sp. SA4-10]|nr:MAG: Uncharacterised protein [Polaribacter sp. SA4-10]
MKNNKIHIILTILLPIQVILVQLAGNHSNIIEKYYSMWLYPLISSLFRVLFGSIPFSVGDIVIGFLLLILFRFLFKLIITRFKNFRNIFLNLTAFLSVIYFFFYLFWGLNYYREPLAKNLGYTKTSHTNKELLKTTNYVLKKLNFYQLEITDNDSLMVENKVSREKIYEMAFEGLRNLEKDYPQLEYKYSSVKSSLISTFQSYNGTSGYFNPFTGEAQVNNLIPKNGYPTTTYHEIAHQIGYAAEDEANFIGFLASNNHDDIYFKYASYRMAFIYLIKEVKKRDQHAFNKIWEDLNIGVIKDFNKSNAFWKSYKNPFEPIIKKGYDIYLKANNQPRGIKSYNYVVNLLISYFNIKFSLN